MAAWLGLGVGVALNLTPTLTRTRTRTRTRWVAAVGRQLVDRAKGAVVGAAAAGLWRQFLDAVRVLLANYLVPIT